MINDSNISPISKRYLEENNHLVSKWQIRGFKYGLFTSFVTFAAFPVIRRQTFVRRFALSMLPMAYFMNYGYGWGHEMWWTKQKEVVVTYEIFTGTRSKFTMK